MMYKCLQKQAYQKGSYSLVPIRSDDMFQIMQWRNEQIYHLRQEELLTPEKQQYYFDNVISSLFASDTPSQILFSYLHNDICIGYGGLVHINWKDKNAEISFLMNTALEENSFAFHWKTFLGMLEEMAFGQLAFNKIYTYAFDVRKHLYSVLEDAGFVQEAVLKEHCLFEKKFIDVYIHSKIKSDVNV